MMQHSISYISSPIESSTRKDVAFDDRKGRKGII